MLKDRIKNNKGFTLVEMLVSITLFSFVITIALGSLFTILKANEKTKVMKTVINNLNIALESMSREIRVGYEYSCPGGECQKFSFKTKNGCEAYYEFKNKTIYRKVPKKAKSDSEGTCSIGDQQEVRIISNRIDIEEMKFRTAGLASGDQKQPRVLINIKGVIKKSGQLTKDEEFDIQTTISQRKVQP